MLDCDIAFLVVSLFQNLFQSFECVFVAVGIL